MLSGQEPDFINSTPGHREHNRVESADTSSIFINYIIQNKDMRPTVSSQHCLCIITFTPVFVKMVSTVTISITNR